MYKQPHMIGLECNVNREALSRGIPARGTLAVLLQASLRGHLDFRVAYASLLRMGFPTSQSLEKAVFQEYARNENGCCHVNLKQF